MSRQLPANPNLEHLKNQAKRLLLSFQQGDAAAFRLMHQQAMAVGYGPYLIGVSVGRRRMSRFRAARTRV